MATKALYLLLLLVPVFSVRPPPNYLLRTSTQQRLHIPGGKDAGQQLILTDYLEAGKIEEAQNLSKVRGNDFPEDIPSYSGFFTVDKSKGSNIFFWFFPAEHDYENAPVVLWLQGGPGASSLFGLFVEMGPFKVSDDASKLIENPYSWHKNQSLIFIDNPIGSGFSYSSSDYFAPDHTHVGNDLYAAMIQFFTLFPNLQKNDFFIAGESYAGKYIPALGHTIHQNNQNASLKINLKGLVIGDGLTDPINQLDHSDYVYQTGMVDNSTWKTMKSYETQARQSIEAGDYLKAFKAWDSSIVTYTGNSGLGYYNILSDDGNSYDDLSDSYITFVEKDSTRASLHVGAVTFDNTNSAAYASLEDNIMQSVASWVEELLDAGYNVTFFNGQLDVVVAYTLSENMFQNLKFKDAAAYKNAERNLWSYNDTVVGYTKKAGGLTEIMVRNAGHLVPADQPAVAFELIYKATRGTF